MICLLGSTQLSMLQQNAPSVTCIRIVEMVGSIYHKRGELIGKIIFKEYFDEDKGLVVWESNI